LELDELSQLEKEGIIKKINITKDGKLDARTTKKSKKVKQYATN
jgi:hypothetical protein